MKNLLLALFIVGFSTNSFSQVGIHIASTGFSIGTYDSNSDVIIADETAINAYLQQKITEGTFSTPRIEKEFGYAYLIYIHNYDYNGANRQKVIAERLFIDEPVSGFHNEGDCEEHSCDGNCTGVPCTKCPFQKMNGKIIGCDCQSLFGECCHKVTTTKPCSKD